MTGWICVPDTLDLSGGNARAVSLPGAGADSTFSGQSATLAGFGQQVAGTTPNGALYRLDANLEEQGDCGARRPAPSPAF